MFTLLALPLAHAASVTLSPGDDVAALTASLQPGDEVVFGAGTYAIPDTLRWTGAGTADAPIVLRGEGDVVLEYSGGWAVAYLGTASHVRISNLTLRTAVGNSNNHSGLVVEDVTDLVVEDVEIGPLPGTALYLGGNNARVTVERAHLHDTTDGNGIYAGCWDASCWTEASSFSQLWIHDLGGDSHGIELSAGCQGVRVADNVLYRVTGWGIVTDSTEYGDRNVVEGNAVWETTGGGISVRGSALVRNNVVFNSAGIGMRLSDGDRGTLENAVVSFNTVADTVDDAVEIHEWAGYSGLVFANNVLANPTGRALYFNATGYDDNVYISHNVVTGLVEGLADTYAGAAEPVLDGGGFHDFTDAEAWDFYPASGAAMVNAGDPAAGTHVPATDFNGAPRDGAAPDAGAYERDGEGNPGWTLQEGFKDLDAYGANGADVQGGCCDDKAAGPGEALLLALAGLGWKRRRQRREPR